MQHIYVVNVLLIKKIGQRERKLGLRKWKNFSCFLKILWFLTFVDSPHRKFYTILQKRFSKTQWVNWTEHLPLPMLAFFNKNKIFGPIKCGLNVISLSKFAENLYMYCIRSWILLIKIGHSILNKQDRTLNEAFNLHII